MIAEVKNFLGKNYLSVMGVSVAVEGQQCFDCMVPGKYWTLETLELVRDRVNAGKEVGLAAESSICVTIKGRRVTLTIDEAMNLREDLRKVIDDFYDPRPTITEAQIKQDAEDSYEG